MLELNRSHLKDLKAFFDETMNMKSMLNSLLQKMENLSLEIGDNKTCLESVKENTEKVAGRTSKLESNLTELDCELQK